MFHSKNETLKLPSFKMPTLSKLNLGSIKLPSLSLPKFGFKPKFKPPKTRAKLSIDIKLDGRTIKGVDLDAARLTLTKSKISRAGALIAKHPKLVAAGMTAAGLGIYAAATNVSFGEAAGKLVKTTAKELRTITKAVNEVGAGIMTDFISELGINTTYLKIGAGVFVTLAVLGLIVKLKN